ncbi:MAG TPA: LytTR family DNA-binding domain-containing protein [Sulfuricurvum sp.]|nr:MAG: DNA-binding response regulator [Campylobacterales bacterium 16-40-21]OZA03075.1 MAG: DNA-binding response regulator [Sulfuricurvum sp. 17-40-25]HQS66839.1 LytTR family DNA-binding domain-containing protein [Sulfuricurvum sp.]HQT37119.1 LytTR family DNA-binding domain-containing protein [Sulfuricurvum sp.]
MNFLIVDDESLAISRLTRLLTSLGHSSITAASNGAEALELASQQKFDIALLDISMSQMDGIELGYALRYQHEDLAIIYQTAYDHHALKAFDVGAVDYLLKPYTAETLERAIARVTINNVPKELRLISKAGENHYLLSPQDLYYVKADLTEVMFRSTEGFSYYPKKISDVEALLEPHGFLRIHRSYLVNLNRVKEMETIDQSRISFSFEGIKETVESSKDGAKQFRHLFK